MCAQQGCQHFQGAGQDIGQHDVVAALCRLHHIGQAATHADGVVAGVVVGGRDCGRVDIHGIDQAGVKLRRAYGKNARAAAVVQHARVAHIGVPRQPAQAHAGGGVRACAKSQPRVQPNQMLGLCRCFVPAGHDPEVVGNGNGSELRLRESHPILIGQGLNAQHLTASKKILCLQQAQCLFGCILGGKQRSEQRALPALFGGRHAGFAKKRLFGVGLGVGIFYRNAQGVQRLKRFADGFHFCFGAQQAQFKHGQTPSRARRTATTAMDDLQGAALLPPASSHCANERSLIGHAAPTTVPDSGYWCRLR